MTIYSCRLGHPPTQNADIYWSTITILVEGTRWLLLKWDTSEIATLCTAEVPSGQVARVNAPNRRPAGLPRIDGRLPSISLLRVQRTPSIAVATSSLNS